MINKKNNLFYIFIILFSFINGFSQSNKNFLILENPFELRIFNKYEQNISFNDSSYFLQYCPIEIIAEDTLLSDEYTLAFIGRLENQTFYFLKPEQNIPFNRLFNSYSNYVKNAVSLLDTIQMVKDNKILFFNAKDKSQKERLTIDTKLVRIFKTGTSTYVKNLTFPIQYGWCDLRNKNAWTVFKSTKQGKTLNLSEIESIIQEKLFKVNELLTKLFNRFNQINRSNIQIPYWTYVNKDNDLVCTLLNNNNNYDFTESTNILINELNLSLAHTSFKVFWQSNEIIIHRI